MPTARPVPRPLGRPATPQLLGFAEPVANVPPIEDFLPADGPAAVIGGDPVEIAALEVQANATASEPADAELQPAIRARVRDLPPPEQPAAPAASPPERPQSFVGRLGRRLGDAYSAGRAAAVPRFDPLPSPAPLAAPMAAATPMARRPAEPPHPSPEPPPKLTTPPPAQIGDRGGRPSLPRNRRLYRRAKLPAEIEIDGVPCTLIDVSIGGFAATGVPLQLQPNALVPVMIRLVIDGIEVGTQLKARIVYVTQGRSAGRFVELSPSQMAFLRYIVTWRGESVGSVGTTTLLDAIAGGADRGFAPGSTGHSELEPKSRWWAGLIGKKINPPR